MPQISPPVVFSSSLALEVQKQGDLCKKPFSTKKITLFFLFQQKEIKYLENVKKQQLKFSDVNHSKHITKK